MQTNKSRCKYEEVCKITLICSITINNYQSTSESPKKASVELCQCFTLILNFLAVETEIQKVKVGFLFLKRWESAGNVRVRILIILDTMSFFIISVSLNSYWGIGILSETGHKKEIRTESFRTPEHKLKAPVYCTYCSLPDVLNTGWKNPL